MTLEELGQEYFSRSVELKKRVADLQPLLSHCGEEKKRKLRKRIKSLREAAYYCSETGARLMDYYKRSSEK